MRKHRINDLIPKREVVFGKTRLECLNKAKQREGHWEYITKIQLDKVTMKWYTVMENVRFKSDNLKEV